MAEISTYALSLLAEGWDAAVRSLKYEDGTPLEIVRNDNPYRRLLEQRTNHVPS